MVNTSTEFFQQGGSYMATWHCHLCNRSSTGVEPNVYLSADMRSAVGEGLRPPSIARFKSGFFGLSRNQIQEMSEEQIENLWLGVVTIDETGWLLCEDCSRRVATDFGLNPATGIVARTQSVGKRANKDAAFYFLLTPSSPSDVEGYLRCTLRDFGHPRVNPFLIRGVHDLPSGDEAYRVATSVGTGQIGTLVNADSDGFLIEGCETSDPEGNRCVIVRIYDRVKTPKDVLPANHQWQEIWSAAKLNKIVDDAVGYDLDLIALYGVGLLIPAGIVAYWLFWFWNR